MALSARAEARLGKFAFVAAGACVVSLALTLLAFAVQPVREIVAGRRPSASYASGGRIDLDRSLYSQTPTTVFVFSRASCSACQASKSIMAGMASDLAKIPSVRVVMLTGQRELAADQAFARDVGIEASRLFQIEMQSLRLRYLPTVVVTDANGTILWSHEGRLTETSRTEIVETARRLPQLQ